jgi:hypothetical protein
MNAKVQMVSSKHCKPIKLAASHGGKALFCASCNAAEVEFFAALNLQLETLAQQPLFNGACSAD